MTCHYARTPLHEGHGPGITESIRYGPGAGKQKGKKKENTKTKKHERERFSARAPIGPADRSPIHSHHRRRDWILIAAVVVGW